MFSVLRDTGRMHVAKPCHPFAHLKYARSRRTSGARPSHMALARQKAFNVVLNMSRDRGTAAQLMPVGSGPALRQPQALGHVLCAKRVSWFLAAGGQAALFCSA